MLGNISELESTLTMNALAHIVRQNRHLHPPVSLRRLLAQRHLSGLLSQNLCTLHATIRILDSDGAVLFGSLPEMDSVRHPIEFEGNILGWVQGGPHSDATAVLLAHILSAEAAKSVDEREQHKLLRAFADASNESLHILDRDLKIIFVNRVTLEALQMAYPEIRYEDIVGRHLLQIYPSLSKQQMDVKLQQVIETSVPYEEEIVVFHPVLGDRYLQVRAFQVGDFLGTVVTDYTERKLAEDGLRVSEERLRSTLTSLDDLVFSLDQDGKFTEYFQPPSRNLIAPPEAFIGRSFREVLPPPIVSLAEETIELARQTNQVQQFEYPLTLDQEERWFDAKISNQKNADDEFCGTTIVVRDISERKLAEEQRLQLRLEQERIRIITDFVRRSSHEFRTPLAVITMQAYLLTLTTNSEEQQQRYNSIEEQVGNITRLVDNMLLLSRLDSHEGIASERIDLNRVLRVICQSRQSAIHDKGLDSQCELSEDPLFVQANADYFTLAIEHLLSNAISHTRSGDRISIRSRQVGAQVVVEIVDTGSGITPDDLPHIFERFYRADKAEARSGFGLGLPIAQSVIERSGGRLEVESVAGEGSTFRVWLPAA